MGGSPSPSPTMDLVLRISPSDYELFQSLTGYNSNGKFGASALMKPHFAAPCGAASSFGQSVECAADDRISLASDNGATQGSNSTALKRLWPFRSSQMDALTITRRIGPVWRPLYESISKVSEVTRTRTVLNVRLTTGT